LTIVTVGAHVRIHIEVVEQDELARELAVVGADLLAEQYQ
jgi:hypothetical protein